MTTPGGTAAAELTRAMAALTGAASDVLAERERQKAVEGWTEAHDDEHSDGALAQAAACYADFAARIDSERAEFEDPPCDWPFPDAWWKPKDRRFDLVRAGALILAEIERLDRAALAGARRA